MAIRPKQAVDRTANLSPSQLEIAKTSIQATAQITSAMISVTNEKNTAKICEAFKTIYKSIQDTVKTST